ncbi:hypothetical protein ACET3X_003232 [Alternaria dauci]|uniref:Uncharacterized protein n=1 Tax=Alternaria dauci TaxID=48095 RepID=A0ABR3US99_9PLEO
MCGFTIVRHTECGHEHVSTTAEHIRLCGWATDRNLQQGIDCAPAPCRISNDTDTRIVATCNLFNYCEDCSAELEIEPRGEDQGVLQKYAHVKKDDIGVYGQEEYQALKDLRDYLRERERRGLKLQEEFDAYVDTQPGGVPHPQLRDFFAQLQPAGYHGLYLNKLRACVDWLSALEQLMVQRAPNKLFSDTVLWVFSQAENVSLVLDRMGGVLYCLRHFEPSRPKQTSGQADQSSGKIDIAINGSETQMDYLVYLLILQHRGCGLGLTNPDFPHFFNPDFRPSFNTRLTFRVREAPRQIRIDKPILRSVQKHKRYEAGTMNLRNLRYELYKGLLEEEPASNCEVEHIKIPDNTERIDVEDGHGNKLVWNADGTPKLIFAGSTPEPSKPVGQTQAEEQPKTQQSGYGFEYSDSDSDTGPEDHRALEEPELSIAGGILDVRADKTEQLEDGSAEDSDDSPALQGERNMPSPPQRARAPLAFVDPNRKIKAPRTRRPKGDRTSPSATLQDPSVVTEDHVKQDKPSNRKDSGTKRKHEGAQNSNGRTGGFDFIEASSRSASASSIRSLSGSASPELLSLSPPPESTR